MLSTNRNQEVLVEGATGFRLTQQSTQPSPADGNPGEVIGSMKAACRHWGLDNEWLEKIRIGLSDLNEGSFFIHSNAGVYFES